LGYDARIVTCLRRIENHDRFFFVTTNVAKNLRPFNSLERDQILAVLSDQHHRGEFFLFGYVVMPTHVHLLLHPHNKNLIQIMRNLKSRTGFAISQARLAPGPIWQERYFDTIVRHVQNFWQKLEYIHRNPVEAGLAKEPEEWLWSSARHYTRKETIPVAVDPVGFSSEGSEYLWPAPWR
jgi:REP element-mobilizing transposase RayT